MNTAASGAATTSSALATGMEMLAVMPGRTRLSTFLSRMRAAKPLMLFLIIACGARRSTLPVILRPGTVSMLTSTSCSTRSRVTSAWLMCALMMRSLRFAMVSTSVPELKPPEPLTAWPFETGRVSTVQSKGAVTRVLRSLSFTRSRVFCARSVSFFASANRVRVSS